MVLRRLEERLERLVEGAFASAFRGGVQPIEVGQRILRAMDNRKFVGLDGPIVANDFLVRLNPADYEQLAPLLGGLIPEFAHAAAGHARDMGYHLVGPIHIVVEPDPAARKGLVDVAASALSDVVATPWPRSTAGTADSPAQAPVDRSHQGPPARPRPTPSPTRQRDPNRSPFAPDAPGSPDAHSAHDSAPPDIGLPVEPLDHYPPTAQRADDQRAAVDEGTREAEGYFGSLEFPDGHRRGIDRVEFVIGRLPACELTLSDPNASRRHAAITTLHGISSVRDLGSTNGTSLNGRKIEGSEQLHDGDRITIGVTTLRFGAPR